MTEKVDERRQWKSFFVSKPFIYASLFCIGLLIFEFIFLDKRDEAEVLILARHAKEGNYPWLLLVLFLSFLSIAPTLIFFYAVFTSPYRYRIFYFLIFCLITLSEYSHYKAFGRFSRFRDIEIAFFSGDWKFTLDAAVMYFNYLALIPIIFFGFFLFWVKRIWKSGTPAFLSILLLSGAFFSPRAILQKISFIQFLSAQAAAHSSVFR